MRRRGWSMLELLVGIVIFSFAMLPLLSLGISTSRGAYSVGKHMMAGQIASSMMDRLLGLSYEDCQKEIKSKASGNVMDDPMLVDILKQPALSGSSGVKTDLDRSFTNFKYELSSSKEEDTRVFEITVKVSWRVDEGKEDSRQFMILRSLKFKETL